MNDKYDYITKDNRIIKATIIIDWKTSLEITFGEKHTYQLLIKIFYNELNNHINILKNIEDTKEIYKILHGIKGTAASLGLNLLSCFCKYYMDIYEEEIDPSNINMINIINLINRLSDITKDEFSSNLDKYFI